jgi:hypothetical protein
MAPDPGVWNMEAGSGGPVLSGDNGVFEDTLELGESLVGVGHLDGAHAEGAGRLEVDPEVIEKHRLLGLNTDRRAREFIKAGIGFAYPQDA